MRLLRPAPVAAALVVLAVAQAVAVTRLPVPLAPTGLEATPENYGFLTIGREMTVTFQLRNGGPRSVRVLGIGEDLPGLDRVDVRGAGEPFGFRAAGTGPDPLPAFDLAPDAIAVVSLTYRLAACTAVPGDARPVPVQVRDGRARGTVGVPLPQLPDDGAEAGDDAVLEWQSVLVRDLCA